jgi:hypothetical protein
MSSLTRHDDGMTVSSTELGVSVGITQPARVTGTAMQNRADDHWTRPLGLMVRPLRTPEAPIPTA